MKDAYPTIITQTKDGSMLVEVPDLDILTEGKDYNDAIYMARDAIGVTGMSMQDAGEEMPSASPVEKIDPLKGTFASDGKSIVTLVDIDFDEYRRSVDQKMVRRSVTLPNWLNVLAEKAHINVSGVLQEALKTKLGVAK